MSSRQSWLLVYGWGSTLSHTETGRTTSITRASVSNLSRFQFSSCPPSASWTRGGLAAVSRKNTCLILQSLFFHTTLPHLRSKLYRLFPLSLANTHTLFAASFYRSTTKVLQHPPGTLSKAAAFLQPFYFRHGEIIIYTQVALHAIFPLPRHPLSPPAQPTVPALDVLRFYSILTRSVFGYRTRRRPE